MFVIAAAVHGFSKRILAAPRLFYFLRKLHTPIIAGRGQRGAMGKRAMGRKCKQRTLEKKKGVLKGRRERDLFVIFFKDIVVAFSEEG